MKDKPVSQEEWDMWCVTQNQIFDLNAHQIATRRILNMLSETYPHVSKAMDSYEEFYQEAMHTFMVNVEKKFGPAVAVEFDKYRDTPEIPP